MHRDVGIGNILWYNVGSKMADLGYAKRIGDTTNHEMCMAPSTTSRRIPFPALAPGTGIAWRRRRGRRMANETH